MTDLLVQNLTKSFGGPRPALAGVDLDVPQGAFVTLLGPSGCGKTTLLRLIAGLEQPSAGTIRLGDQVVAGSGQFVAAEDRHLGMVFQSYALWPHMDVARNVSFGLEVANVPAAERRRRVGEALATVGLEAYASRRPAQLSGGQRQRVALARCLALRTPLILLDEPLANLDADLRESMQREFRRIHRETGTSFIHVTHDQAEAMALADVIAVMADGAIQQMAPPDELYRQPANAMVARFVGRGSLLPVSVLGSAGPGRVAVTHGGARFEVRGAAGSGDGLLCIRPEDLALAGPATSGIPAQVTDSVYRGGAHLVSADAAGETLHFIANAPAVIGETVSLAINDGWLLPAVLETRNAA